MCTHTLVVIGTRSLRWQLQHQALVTAREIEERFHQIEELQEQSAVIIQRGKSVFEAKLGHSLSNCLFMCVHIINWYVSTMRSG